MRERFGWVSFFSKLAGRIDDEGPVELNQRAKRIDWRLPDPSEGTGPKAYEPLFGLDEIDPLTFFSYLATRTRYPDGLQEALGNVGRAFDVGESVDLRRYGSLDEVGRAIQSDTSSWPMHDRLALWEFSHVMKPGETIFVKRGNDAIGHGTVRSEYRYDENRDSHRHVRHVGWESNFPDGLWVREKPLVVKTLTDITKYPDQVRAFKEAIRQASTCGTKEPKAAHPRNQILYGPPGTGKTYSTVSRALAIIDGKEVGNEVTTDDKRHFSTLRFKDAASPDEGETEGRIARL